MPGSPARRARCRLRSKRWRSTPPPSSRRSASSRSTCWASRSAAWSPRNWRSTSRRPRGGVGMASLTPEAQRVFGATYEHPDDLWLGVFFTPSDRSQAAGREYLKRFRLRREGRDPEVGEKVAPAQIEALSKWGAPRENPYAYLKTIHQPTLVVNGGADVIVYTVNSFILQQHIPNAQLMLY